MAMNVALIIYFCPSFIRRPEGDIDRNIHNHFFCKGTQTKKKKGLMYNYLPHMRMLSSRVASYATTLQQRFLQQHFSNVFCHIIFNNVFCNIDSTLSFTAPSLLHFDFVAMLCCALILQQYYVGMLQQHLVPNHLTTHLLQNQITTMTFPLNNDYIHVQVLAPLLAMLKFWLQQCSSPPTNYNNKV